MADIWHFYKCFLKFKLLSQHLCFRWRLCMEWRQTTKTQLIDPNLSINDPLCWGSSGDRSIPGVYDDVMKWKHFPRYWPFVRGIHRPPVNSPHKGQWRWALMFTLICARINGGVKKHEAGDFETPSRPLWRHRNERALMGECAYFVTSCWILTLTAPVFQMPLDLTLPREVPITFRLTEGSGPIHVTAQHIVGE